MKIVTNNRERYFVYGHEVPAKVMAEQFDHLDDVSKCIDGFFKYRNYWYHISDFIRVEDRHGDGDDGFFSAWDGYASDSFFSGIVIKFFDDCESYKVGTYYA